VYARVLVDGKEYRPRINRYATSADNIATPAVRYRVLGDTYLVMTAFDTENQRWASVRLIESPLVSWIWVGTVIVVLGAGLTLVTSAPQSVTRRSGAALSAAD
jgi:cytochrome c-type biogenesis protein CcmF